MATAGDARIIRYSDLEPSWHLLQAKEPGHLRWIMNWVGGGAGYINSNPDNSAISERYVVGLMGLQMGNRQPGIHTHSVTEIYVVLSGELEGVDASGALHRAGPLDCMYTPAGVPHGVRSCGNEDASFVWLHDRLEKKGTSVYSEITTSKQALGGICVVRHKDLEPSWNGTHAKEAGTMRWTTSFVVGGATARAARKSILSERIALGMLVLPPGNRQPVEEHSFATTYISLGFGLVSNCGNKATPLERLDAVYVPAGAAHSLRNAGEAAAFVLWANDQPTGFD